MKIIDRKIIDANLMPNKFMIEMMFRCKLEKVYVYNLKHEDGAIGAISAYFNRRDNIIYMMISKKTTEGIKHIGAVEVKEGQYGIEETILDGDKKVIDTYRDIIDELSLEIFRKEHTED
nr:hypothetical protein [uncultured Romboutsia sp.]